MTLDSRALCVICGAPSIGKKSIFFFVSINSISILKGEILMHILVYLVKVTNIKFIEYK